MISKSDLTAFASAAGEAHGAVVAALIRGSKGKPRATPPPMEKPLARLREAAKLTNEDFEKTMQLIWYRLVEISPDSQVRLISSQGSGDLVSLSLSDGFVEIPIGAQGSGPWQVRWW